MADGNFENMAPKDAPIHSRPDEQASPLLRVVPDFEKIDGWLKLDVSELLFAAAASVKTGCIVEIGCYRGRSTVALCAGSSTGAKIPVFAIDPHEHFVGAKGGIYGHGDRKAFFRTMLTTKFSGIVRLINTSSEVIAPGWDKPVSLLFIDGDHRYEAVLSDFTVWRPHLVDNALVIFHDAAGTGTSLLIKDLQNEGSLTHVQTVGRLAMFRFNAVDGHVDPEGIAAFEVAPAYPRLAAPTQGDRLGNFSKTLYYSARGNYLYRVIPKCACTTIKTVLLELEGLPIDPIPSRRHKKRLNNFPGTEALSAEAEADLFAGRTDAFKFVIVRDPYTRMASSYADKIAAGYLGAGKYWINLITDAAKQQGIKLSEKITFEEFIRVASAQPADDMDPHWKLQFHCGAFETIKFDFIGRLETISSDLTYILERIGAPQEIMHRAIQPHNATGSGIGMWSTVHGDVRRDFLKAFSVDFDTFCYPRRFSSVMFSPVNVDKPKPSAFHLPENKKGKSPKRLKRKIRRQHTDAEVERDDDDDLPMAEQLAIHEDNGADD